MAVVLRLLLSGMLLLLFGALSACFRRSRSTLSSPLALADNVNIEMNLDPRIFTPTCPTADIVLYGRNKNLLRYKFGMLSKKFA